MAFRYIVNYDDSDVKRIYVQRKSFNSLLNQRDSPVIRNFQYEIILRVDHLIPNTHTRVTFNFDVRNPTRNYTDLCAYNVLLDMNIICHV